METGPCSHLLKALNGWMDELRAPIQPENPVATLFQAGYDRSLRRFRFLDPDAETDQGRE